MSRRLPVYLLIDVSASMSGEPIEAVKNGLQVLVSTLRQDPYALETAYLSVITFGSQVAQVVHLTELATFQQPNITPGGATDMGAALKLLAQKIDQEIVKSSAETKGDWKPLVFLMTDGAPTDDWQSGLAELKKRKTGMFVACAAGLFANLSVLKQLTDNVVQLDSTDSNTIKSFFKWVSASVSMGSQKVDSGQKEVTGLSELPPPPPEVSIVT